MNRVVILWSAALAGLVALPAGPARAQAPGARWNPRPVVSPYLNLTRGGSLAVNYYDLVRPQIEYGKAINSLQTEVTANQQAIANVDAAVGGQTTTGHSAQFMTYKRYFQTRGTLGTTTGTGATAPTLRTGTAGSTTRSQTSGLSSGTSSRRTR